MTVSLTVILPYFNEQGWVGKTIDSLVAQSDQDFLLLAVNNGSQDEGEKEARIHARPLGARAVFLDEPLPGKSNAIAAALSLVQTDHVAICDADTLYPIFYVSRIKELFSQAPDIAAVMAIDLYLPPEAPASQKRIRMILRKARCFPSKCHAGGYAQAFRTDILREVAAFDTNRWPYLLEDHEVAHRVMRLGRAVYDAGHYCFPSSRRANRTAMDWTRGERLVYRYVPKAWLGWFFYQFLGPRLARRGAIAAQQRHQPWKETV